MKDLINLKRSNSEKNTLLSDAVPSEEDYPYGTRIHLEEEELKKLSIPSLEPSSEMMMTAKVKVVSHSIDSNEDNEREHVTLQIMEMAFDDNEEKPDTETTLYG